MSILDHTTPKLAKALQKPEGQAASRLFFLACTLLITLAILTSFTYAVQYWSWVPWVVAPFACANALWIAGGASTAILGLLERASSSTEVDWVPSSKTAILLTLCGEDTSRPVAYLSQLTRTLKASRVSSVTDVFVLSDTFNPEAIKAEEMALTPLIRTGRIKYRRRTKNTGKKPGNIAQWLREHGADFDFMMVLDADSRMTVSRVKRMIWQLETKPKVGLLQAGIALIPGQSRLGNHQRNASRLLSRNFGRGFAAWTGETGSYWGHNAIMRVEAFKSAAALPVLSGTAPLGGPLISHDFVEAAWICRAGWRVELDPDVTGSCEDAPQTFQEFFKRDRRWCQGNLQHLRVLFEPGLRLISRLHLLLGIFSYLAAPIWVFFLALVSLKALAISGVWPFVLVALTLLIPKICALIDAISRARTAWRTRVFLRAWFSELGISTLLAPIVMLRQTAAVGSVLVGNDCGWKSGRKAPMEPVLGLCEAMIGLVILLLSLSVTTIDTLWLAPIFISLISAPFLMRALEVSK